MDRMTSFRGSEGFRFDPRFSPSFEQRIRNSSVAMKAIVLSSAAQAWTSIIEWSGIAGFLMVRTW